MSSFKVVESNGNYIVPERVWVVLETDDWVLAAQAALVESWPRGTVRSVWGVHPSHDWELSALRPVGAALRSPNVQEGSLRGVRSGARCRSCGSTDNGSYGSLSPCGYDWSRDSLVGGIRRELAARGAAA